MSKYLLLLTLLIGYWSLTAQESDSTKTGTLTILETQPEFPGGMQGFFNYVSKNMRYPADARKAGIEGRVYVQFVIGKEGFIEKESVSVPKGLYPSLDEEACRIMRESPQWTPAYQEGRPVKVRMALPIIFKLSAGGPAKEKKKKSN